VHQIGEVAEAVGLSLRTIRHWDDVGLVPPSGRSVGGFRLYTDSDVERLRVVKHMKPLGFSLEDMRTLLDIMDRLGRRAKGRERTALLERLAGFADVADASCARLRDELAAAEGFAAILHRETDSHLATSGQRTGR
jgi:DNA-binding transcriptional MerR regulator